MLTLCLSKSADSTKGDWIRLNVGGRIFETTRATLTQDSESMLAVMFTTENWKRCGFLSVFDGRSPQKLDLLVAAERKQLQFEFISGKSQGDFCLFSSCFQLCGRIGRIHD